MDAREIVLTDASGCWEAVDLLSISPVISPTTVQTFQPPICAASLSRGWGWDPHSRDFVTTMVIMCGEM